MDGSEQFSTHRTVADRTAGPKSALGSAIGCGILLGVFEGKLRADRKTACTATDSQVSVSSCPACLPSPSRLCNVSLCRT